MITGVFGLGKSILVFGVHAKMTPNKENHLDEIDEIVEINQHPIHRMKRSNIATYIDLYRDICKLFSKTREAKEKEIKSSMFSFKTKGGRCENGEGLGYVVSNMLFFKDEEVTCPIYHGQQFQPFVLDIKYNHLNIKEVLELSVAKALTFFNVYTSIREKLSYLDKVELEYLQLGQSLMALSGGEVQRLKLAKFFLTNKSKHILYLLD